MRRRLREEVAVDYQAVRDNFVWPDHVLRLLVTAGAVAWLSPTSVADPACGDATIMEAAYRLRPFARAFLGDISQPQVNALHPSFPAVRTAGDAQAMLQGLPETVDVVVLTEILEHVADPDNLLQVARGAAKHLVASSPISEDVSIGNHEHLWSWDQEGYREMLTVAGWAVMAYTEIAFPGSGYPYTYQLWVCR